MRLIMEYTVSDGFTWWATRTIPVIYQSEPEFKDDFELILLSMIDERKALQKMDRHEEFITSFEIGGQKFDFFDFVSWGEDKKEPSYELPVVYSVDKWFEEVEKSEGT